LGRPTSAMTGFINQFQAGPKALYWGWKP
jgi:hypothetical protein